MNLSCPVCRLKLAAIEDRFKCFSCNASTRSGLGRRTDFSDFFRKVHNQNGDRVSLAYRFYSIAYAPLALLNMLFVWKANLGQLVFHYRSAMCSATHPILDVAIGDGALTKLASRGVSLPHPLVGLDFAEEMLSQAEIILGHLPDFRTIKADACAIPFPEAEFRTICCYGGLHVISDADKAMSEMTRVLAPGGEFHASILLIPGGLVANYLSRRYVELGFLSNRFTRPEAEALITKAGLNLTSSTLNGRMLLVSARKPD